MKKREFLDLLRFYLRQMPNVVINDIIADYEEHFEIAMENGKTEEQVTKELGSPEVIAKDYIIGERNIANNINNEMYNKKIKEDVEGKNFKSKNKLNDEHSSKKSNVWTIFFIILAIIGAITVVPVVFGVGIGVLGAIAALIVGIFGVLASIVVMLFSLIMAWFVVGGSLIFAGILTGIHKIFTLPENYSIPTVFYDLSPLTLFFISVSLVSIGILVIITGIYFNRLLFIIMKKAFIGIKWNMQKRKMKKQNKEKSENSNIADQKKNENFDDKNSNTKDKVDNTKNLNKDFENNNVNENISNNEILKSNSSKVSLDKSNYENFNSFDNEIENQEKIKNTKENFDIQDENNNGKDN